MLTLVAAVIAFAQSRVKPREGRFAHVVPALGLFLLYYLLLLLARQALADGKLPGVFGLWPVHAAFAAVAWWLFRRAQRPAAV